MRTHRVVVPKHFSNGDEFASWIDQVYAESGGSDFVEIPRSCGADLIPCVMEDGKRKKENNKQQRMMVSRIS